MNRSKTMAGALKADGYEEWIRSIKERIQRARVKASMLVNSEQTLLYWDIGHDILEKQDKGGWGTKVVERMSADLKAEFPDMKGWSRSNLMYMCICGSSRMLGRGKKLSKRHLDNCRGITIWPCLSA